MIQVCCVNNKQHNKITNLKPNGTCTNTLGWCHSLLRLIFASTLCTTKWRQLVYLLIDRFSTGATIYVCCVNNKQHKKINILKPNSKCTNTLGWCHSLLRLIFCFHILYNQVVPAGLFIDRFSTVLWPCFGMTTIVI